MARRRLIFACLLLPSLLQAQDRYSCAHSVYAGFDSRLGATPIALLSEREAKVVDFVLRDRRPVILTANKLLTQAPDQSWAAMPLIEGALGLVVRAGGELQITTRKRVIELAASGRTERPLAADLLARAGKRGEPAVVQARSTGNAFVIEAPVEQGNALALATLPSRPTALGWNANGLSFVAGQTLWVWRADTKDLTALVTDTGLNAARSTCLAADGRVIVGLERTTMVLSRDYGAPIAGIGAYCDLMGDELALYDANAGIVWQMKLPADVGVAASDRRHAEALVQQARGGSEVHHLAEAARLVGCKQMENWRAEGR